MDYRFAELADIPALAEAHSQIQLDEGAAERSTPPELEKRFWEWLGGDHRVVLFERDQRLAAYALYLLKAAAIELLQFFVRRDLRGTDAGREAFELLRDEIWPAQARIEVEASLDDTVMLEFWRSLGFSEKHVKLVLEGPPTTT